MFAWKVLSKAFTPMIRSYVFDRVVSGMNGSVAVRERPVKESAMTNGK